MLVLKTAPQLAKHTKRRDGQTDRFITADMSVITPIFIMASLNGVFILKLKKYF